VEKKKPRAMSLHGRGFFFFNWQVQACSSVTLSCRILSNLIGETNMDEQIIFIYCICSDLTASLGIRNDPQCKMNSAEVMTVAIVAALFFGGNFSQSRSLLKSHGYIRNMLSESRLNRRMHEIDISVWQSIFQAFARIFEEQEQNFEYLYR
jgi:hypothetical protein